ncbi:MAG: hypothetical protein CVU86_06260 [Firmicutes bacterium HGW-Firmicutes-11]|jgi:putative transport protein|nr:MAG: hypothetical protein CVU86_06260 [Firmicutes bacterium HGW-Firmicutes-11]
MDPFVLMFLVVALGLALGQAKIGRFSLGNSGPLFVGLAVGWGVFRLSSHIIERGEGADGYGDALRILEGGVIHSHFFNVALMLFVASVGLLAAKDMRVVLKKYGGRFIALGLLITFIGALSTYAATSLMNEMDPYEVAGVYTGALTSSPGLAAALETAEDHATRQAAGLSKEEQTLYIREAKAGVGAGHAIGYPFGVLIVILAVNFLPALFRIDVEEEKRRYRIEMETARALDGRSDQDKEPFRMVPFAVTCLAGYLVGSIQIPLGALGRFSLGATGGILLLGLALGSIGKIGPLSFRMDAKALALLREIGLSFFLAIVGLNYGYKAVEALLVSGTSLALLSLGIGFISVMAGFLVGRYVFRLNWVMLAGALCGGMTSTPGLGTAISSLKSDDPAAGYGATYPFALVGMILYTILLHQVPVL